MNDSWLSSWGSLFPANDEQAMSRVKTSDDPHAFAQLVQRWESPIQRLCTRMLGDAHRGEDLAQDTFARLFAKRKDYEPSGRFSTFLWRMALNLCYDELRRRKRRPETPLEDEMMDQITDLGACSTAAGAPDALLLERETGELVRQAVLQLPEIYRTVVVLRHYENLKFREIAEVLQIPEGTVKSRMAEALAQLHDLLNIEHNQAVLWKTERKQESLVL